MGQPILAAAGFHPTLAPDANDPPKERCSVGCRRGPAGRGLGFASAYARYRSGGEPVYWAEYGFDIGADGTSATNMAYQSVFCDSMMRLVNEDGSNAAAVWWMPGGLREDIPSDYGIFNPDGSPRPAALTLAQWGATFAANPPAQPSGVPVTMTIDRDADARGDIGLFLLKQRPSCRCAKPAAR